MPSYSTLQSVRMQTKLAPVGDDAKLVQFIADCSRAIEVYCGQNFDIRVATHDFGGEINGAKLFLDSRPLLSAATVTNGDGSVLAPAVYDLLPKSMYPKESIRVILGTFWVPPVSSTWRGVPVAYAEEAIAVLGEYGYVPHYATAWAASGALVGAGGIDASAVSLPINAAGLIDVGHVIKIGTEQLRVKGPVVATASALNLTVERGYNGTTAAAHAANDAIAIFQVDNLIEWACREFVASAYKSMESPSGKALSPSGFGSVTVADMPDKVIEKLIHPLWNWRYGQVKP